MLRKTVLGLLVCLVVPHVAAAAPLRFVFTPVDPDSAAQGTLRITEGKPSDDVFRVQLSLRGLVPYAQYLVRVFGPNDYDDWQVDFWANGRGSATVTATLREPATRQIMSATNAEIRDGVSNLIIMIGVLR